jgi:hypothetical protein
MGEKPVGVARRSRNTSCGSGLPAWCPGPVRPAPARLSIHWGFRGIVVVGVWDFRLHRRHEKTKEQWSFYLLQFFFL